MRCPECGRELETEEFICKNCGAKRSENLNGANLEDILNTRPSVSAEQLKPKPVDEYFAEVEAYVNHLLTEPVEAQETPAQTQEASVETQEAPVNVLKAPPEVSEMPSDHQEGTPEVPERAPADFPGDVTDDPQEKAQPRDVLPRRRRRTGIVIGCAVLCLTAVSAFWLMQKQRANRTALDAFEQSTQQLQLLNDIPDSKLQKQVKELYETCIQAVKNKKYGSFDALDQDIDALIKAASETSELSGQFLALQTKYETLDENYDLSANDRKQWERLMNEAAAAAADVSVSDYDTLSQSLEDFVQALCRENEDRIDGIKASVAQMDLTKATLEDLERLKTLENQMNEQMLSGQYKQALETADAWQKQAREISDRVVEGAANADSDGDGNAPVSGESAGGSGLADNGTAGGDTADPDPDAETEFVFKDSDSRYLTEEDLEGMDAWQLLMARNEIYARHGRLFSNPEIQAYFNEKSWYQGTVAPEVFDAQIMDIFNDYELANIEFIRAHESLQ
ncbi:MAG: YARHG domain-containing protein [Catenibacillus sp.]